MHGRGPAVATAFGKLLLEVEHALAADGAEGRDLRVEIGLYGEQAKAIGDFPVDREITRLRDRRAGADERKRYPDAKRSDGTTNPLWSHIDRLLPAKLSALQEQL